VTGSPRRLILRPTRTSVHESGVRGSQRLQPGSRASGERYFVGAPASTLQPSNLGSLSAHRFLLQLRLLVPSATEAVEPEADAVDFLDVAHREVHESRAPGDLHQHDRCNEEHALEASSLDLYERLDGHSSPLASGGGSHPRRHPD